MGKGRYTRSVDPLVEVFGFDAVCALDSVSVGRFDLHKRDRRNGEKGGGEERDAHFEIKSKIERMGFKYIDSRNKRKSWTIDVNTAREYCSI